MKVNVGTLPFFNLFFLFLILFVVNCIGQREVASAEIKSSSVVLGLEAFNEQLTLSKGSFLSFSVKNRSSSDFRSIGFNFAFFDIAGNCVGGSGRFLLNAYAASGTDTFVKERFDDAFLGLPLLKLELDSASEDSFQSFVSCPPDFCVNAENRAEQRCKSGIKSFSCNQIQCSYSFTCA